MTHRVCGVVRPMIRMYRSEGLHLRTEVPVTALAIASGLEGKSSARLPESSDAQASDAEVLF